MPPPVAGLSRLLSWQEGDEHVMHLQGPQREGGAEACEAAAPPPPLLATSTTPGHRAVQVAQLEAYLEGLCASEEDSRPLVELPAAFPSLVQRLLQDWRNECATLRGWLAAAGSSAQPVETAAAPARPTPHLAAASMDAAEPKLGAALLKMQQLDGALAAVDQQAAAVAAARREHEWKRLQEEAGAGSGSSSRSEGPVGGEPASAEGGLAGAMVHERSRLRQQERLEQAMQDGCAGDGKADAGEGNTTGGVTPAEGCSGNGSADDASSGSKLSLEQEALVEQLLREPDMDGDAADASNPYAEAALELAAIDAQLAALAEGTSSSGGKDIGEHSDTAVGGDSKDSSFAQESEPTGQQLEAAPSGDAGSEGSQESSEPGEQGTSRADYLRAMSDARAVAQRLRSIDAALRRIRTGTEIAC